MPETSDIPDGLPLADEAAAIAEAKPSVPECEAPEDRAAAIEEDGAVRSSALLQGLKPGTICSGYGGTEVPPLQGSCFFSALCRPSRGQAAVTILLRRSRL
jgi:hypothetical protein